MSMPYMDMLHVPYINIDIKMATNQGYQCEFVEVVPEDLYCRKCSLVARRLTITDCCGESFCHNCIAGPQQQTQPCPACGENNFNTFKHVKNQRRISQLMVYCSMKERGCGWSGTLEQLDTHLDPHQDNCQYVDTECPLNCLKTIPKNNLDDHLAQHCAKRAYVCRHCSFKATYEEVVDTHLPQCKYVPLDCPNRCGATFERDFLEDHMKMCRLEEVECELRGVGCGGRFLREDQEEHTRLNSQKHLTLTASLAVETKEQLQQKLLELDQRHKEEEEKLKNKIEDQEEKLEHQEEKLEEQEEKLEKLEEKLEKLEEKLEQQEKNQEERIKIQVQLYLFQADELQKLNRAMFFNQRFEIKNFSSQKHQQIIWMGPDNHTHLAGYKFRVSMCKNTPNRYIRNYRFKIFALPGAFDGTLKWPARATFTIELINQHGGNNISKSKAVQWNKPIESTFVTGIDHDYYINHVINHDTLSFSCKVN